MSGRPLSADVLEAHQVQVGFGHGQRVGGRRGASSGLRAGCALLAGV